MNRKKIGVALGGGAARGLAHIGVLQVLLENKIPIDYMSGCSAGAIIGALYCTGSDMYLLEKVLSNMNERSILDFTIPKKGFIKGEKAEGIIKILTKNKSFEQCAIPFAVVACDLVSAKCITISQGQLHSAIRASISIPGVFEPVEWGEMLLVDGGVTNRVPIDAVRSMGANYTIAVDVAYRGWQREKPKNIVDILVQSFEMSNWETVQRLLIDSDVLLEPDVVDFNLTSLAQTAQCIKKGREATEAVIDKIKADLELD